MFLRRNPIGLFALGVFALVSVFGQGLHFLPSANHFSADEHACGHCHHHSSTPASESDSDLDHDCPICRFLAQAQLQSDVKIEITFAHRSELASDRQPLRMSLSLGSLPLARAPPRPMLSRNG